MQLQHACQFQPRNEINDLQMIRDHARAGLYRIHDEAARKERDPGTNTHEFNGLQFLYGNRYDG